MFLCCFCCFCQRLFSQSSELLKSLLECGAVRDLMSFLEMLTNPGYYFRAAHVTTLIERLVFGDTFCPFVGLCY